MTMAFLNSAAPYQKAVEVLALTRAVFNHSVNKMDGSIRKRSTRIRIFSVLFWLSLSATNCTATNADGPPLYSDQSFPLKRRRQWRSSIKSRSIFMFSSLDDWMLRQEPEPEQRQTRCQGIVAPTSMLAASGWKARASTSHYNENENEDKIEEYSDDDDEDLDEMITEPYPSKELEQKKPKKTKMWPPYPFNLLQEDKDVDPAFPTESTQRGPALRAGGTLWTFIRKRARVSGRQMQDITSRLWFHLPPSIPPLIFLTLIPRQEQQLITTAEAGMEQMVSKTVIPLFSNPLARGLVLGGVSLAIMSWAHSELNRLRKLTPLPLNEAYRDNIHSAVLPTFLPEEISDPYMLEEKEEEDTSLSEDQEYDPTAAEDGEQQAKSSISNKLLSSLPPRLQKHFHQFGTGISKPTRSPIKNLRKMRDARRKKAQKIRRMQIYDELVALQAIKRRAKQQQKQRHKEIGKYDGNSEEDLLGYALVTGASRGIGRAIAVELARWEIPLILVARDLSRLTSLAYDLEACYGIKCCVLQADLSEPKAAEQIYQSTRQAGLHVDILINNAGVSSNGLAVDMPMTNVERMIQVNAMSVTKLAHLYGKDMKERRRGRILMVSSVVGAVSAGPTVALYAATKSFEKMLGLSMAKELEPYGVAVTCVMPGAVRDTDFRTRSKTHEALVWRLPFYTKTPSDVAELGVRALLRGDVEVTPGILNRVFLKVLKPGMPQRLHNIMVEMAWNPLQMPPFLKFWQSQERRQEEREMQLEQRFRNVQDEAQKHDTELQQSGMQEETWRPRYNSAARGAPPPLMLMIPNEEDAGSETSMGAEPSPGPTPSGGVPEDFFDPLEDKAEVQAVPCPQAEYKDERASLQAEETDHTEETFTESADEPTSEHTRTQTNEDDLFPKDETEGKNVFSGLGDLSDFGGNGKDESLSTLNMGDNTSKVRDRNLSTSKASMGQLPMYQDQQSQAQILQLQEQFRHLQQKVQNQERQQLLQQLQQQQQQREMHRERQKLGRQKEKLRHEGEERYPLEEEQSEGGQRFWKSMEVPEKITTRKGHDSSLRYDERPITDDVNPTLEQENSSPHIDDNEVGRNTGEPRKKKPLVIQKQKGDRDVLTESLEHPFLSRP